MKFKDIQVGDKVVLELSVGMGRKDYEVATVTKLTKTQMIVKDKRFKRETGIQYERVEKWQGINRVHLVTDEMLKKVERTKLGMMAYKLKTYDYGKLVDDNPELLKEIFSKLIS